MLEAIATFLLATLAYMVTAQQKMARVAVVTAVSTR